MLALPEVEAVLLDAARAAAVGIGLSCGITYVTGYGAVTVASSDALANAVDEVQYDAGQGPYLEALRTRTVIRVDDMADEQRWSSYRGPALHAGVRSSLSYPLVVDDRSVGAMNVYCTTPGPWPADREAAIIVASDQVAGALQAVRYFAADVVRDPVAVRNLRDRHEFDIAIGMVMAEHGYDDELARTELEHRAATAGIPIRTLVARMVAAGDSDAEETP